MHLAIIVEHNKGGSMNLEQLLQYLNSGNPLASGTEAFELMERCTHEAMRLTAELNSAYHTPDEVRDFMHHITGREIDDSFRLFPPFYTDFGKNIRLGKNVFINACCCFQDQGGIDVGDGALIGHRVTLATINHGLSPDERHIHHVAPIVIGENVWIGSGATLLPGVTVGDGAVVAAGAVVSKSVEAGSIVGGVPARFIRRAGSHKQGENAYVA
ncbi:MAG: sugar O-acetyltransferase [Desulfovibrio sp.]|uniref:acyltransferase n=1 Tax=Desulfovibrio sp. TaxID=885 RepID=UPI0025911EFC|nr:DapH/DapD/GlmU-related protein [Desulfovibrio sp.]MCD7984500.1 sugar O-acetyltransferase [Desulfovibrio sp.]